MPITLLLADDAASVRTAIKHLLETQTGITRVGKAANFPETLVMCAELKPNIVLLDLHMPGDHLEPQYVKSQLLDCAKCVLAMSVGMTRSARRLPMGMAQSGCSRKRS